MNTTATPSVDAATAAAVAAAVAAVAASASQAPSHDGSAPPSTAVAATPVSVSAPAPAVAAAFVAPDAAAIQTSRAADDELTAVVTVPAPPAPPPSPPASVSASPPTSALAESVLAANPTVVTLASPSRAPASSSSEAKKTGRPVHPLWAHFHRGDKRNRYHYHAFCAYCVDRFGAEHVAPTRGVSIDMLRHLEKCANCPRHVVEQIKDECGRRDAVRFDRYALKRKQQIAEHAPTASPAASSQASSTAGAAPIVCIGMTIAPASAAAASATAATVPDPTTSLAVSSQTNATASSQTIASHTSSAATDATSSSLTAPAPTTAPSASISSSSPHKRARVDLNTTNGSTAAQPPAQGTLPHDVMVSLLKVAVSSGLSPEIFENRDFQDVIKHARPQLRAMPRDAWSAWLDASTVHATAQNMGLAQLRRVQDAQREATGKHGLCLSLNSWTTLDRQHIVAFTVASPTGDLVCVRVIDMGAFHADPDPDDELDHVADVHHQPSVLLHSGGSTATGESLSRSNGVTVVSGSTATPRREDDDDLLPYSAAQLARHIEDVLLQLEAQDIPIASIVADSMVALNAARRVAMLGTQGRDGSLGAPRDALLVVPCFARMLSVLAGAVLTDRAFVDVVAEMIEITSYLFNDSIRAAVRDMQRRVRPSQDASVVDALRFVQPNREHWLSFVSCIANLLPCRDALVALCSGVAAPELSTLRSVPHGLKVLVLGGGQSEPERSTAFGSGSFWSRLELLQRFLAPLADAHRVFFQRSQPLSPPTRLPNSQHQERHVVDTEFAAARNLTLGDVMYQLGRLTQQYAALASELPAASASHQLSQTMLQHLDVMWQRYEMPGMLLAYVLNHELDSALLDMTKTPDAWSAIAQYVQLFYDRWFQPGEGWSRGGHRATRGPETTDADATADSQQPPRASQLTLPQIVGWLDAIRSRQAPFDSATKDVLSFYASIATTHPQLAALGCRLFAVPVCTAPVSRVVQGVGVVPSATRSTRDPDAIELLLHTGFASSLRRIVDTSVLKNGVAFSSGTLESRIIDAEAWHALAEDWQAFVAHEVNMTEFHELTERVAQDDDVVTALLAIKVPLQQLFVQLLPTLDVSSRRLVSTSSGTANGAASTTVTSSVQAEPPQGEVVLSSR
ncbi:hypothetical protein PINS_up002822 [Pythium insidiosum]|nr:hypothetical protein PINS_up002822 [Pythium insidiosum]